MHTNLFQHTFATRIPTILPCNEFSFPPLSRAEQTGIHIHFHESCCKLAETRYIQGLSVYTKKQIRGGWLLLKKLRQQALRSRISFAKSPHLHTNTLQHAATRCNTLQHAATRCNTLQHAATTAPHPRTH